jgi:hypothetical protein
VLEVQDGTHCRPQLLDIALEKGSVWVKPPCSYLCEGQAREVLKSCVQTSQKSAARSLCPSLLLYRHRQIHRRIHPAYLAATLKCSHIPCTIGTGDKGWIGPSSSWRDTLTKFGADRAVTRTDER